MSFVSICMSRWHCCPPERTSGGAGSPQASVVGWLSGCKWGVSCTVATWRGGDGGAGANRVGGFRRFYTTASLITGVPQRSIVRTVALT